MSSRKFAGGRGGGGGGMTAVALVDLIDETEDEVVGGGGGGQTFGLETAFFFAVELCKGSGGRAICFLTFSMDCI